MTNQQQFAMGMVVSVIISVTLAIIFSAPVLIGYAVGLAVATLFSFTVPRDPDQPA